MDNNIAVLTQPEYLNNGLQTFEKNVNNYLLKQPNYSPISHNYRPSNRRSYPFSRTIQIHKTARKIKNKANGYDKIFLPSQSRATFDPDCIDAQVIPYVHDVLPFTSSHSHGTNKGLKKMA